MGVRIGELSKSMGSVVKGMDTVLHSMDPTKISQLMGKFEQHFDSLDLNVAVMDEAMDQSTAGIIPAEQVDELIAMTADEHGLQLGREFDALQPATEQPEEASADRVAGPSDVSRVL